MSRVRLLVGTRKGAFVLTAVAQQKAAPYASREQAIQLLRREGILQDAIRVDSANWGGQF